MGITLHYKGTLNNPIDKDNVIAVITDIAENAGWSIQKIDDEDKHLRGVILGVHEKCEPLPFLFDAYGQLRSVFWLIDIAKPTELWIFSKTQFAGVEAHIVSIKFLEFMKKNYISNLEVNDETEYWTHRDINILQQKFQQMNFIIDSVGAALNNLKFDREKESIDELVNKIEKSFEDVHNKIKNKL